MLCALSLPLFLGSCAQKAENNQQCENEVKTERELSRMVIDRLLGKNKGKKQTENQPKKQKVKKSNIPDMNTSQIRDFIG